MSPSASSSLISASPGTESRFRTVSAWPPASFAAQRHAGDVHAVLAHERADVADDAGPVAIFEEEQHALGLRLHVAAVDLHDARRAAEERARDGDPAALAGRGEFDEFREIRRRCSRATRSLSARVVSAKAGALTTFTSPPPAARRKPLSTARVIGVVSRFVDLAAEVDVQAVAALRRRSARGKGRAFRRRRGAARSIASVFASMFGMFTALRTSPLQQRRADLLARLRCRRFPAPPRWTRRGAA